MVHTIQLGEQQRTVLFGNLAFRRLKEETDTTLGDIATALQDQDVSILSIVLYYGLRAGERYDKKEPGTYNADDVALWMDIEGGVATTVLPWLLDAIMDASGEQKTEGEAADAKKKKK